MRALALTLACVRAPVLVLLCTFIFAQSDSRIPPEVRYKSGYINPVPRPKRVQVRNVVGDCYCRYSRRWVREGTG